MALAPRPSVIYSAEVRTTTPNETVQNVAGSSVVIVEIMDTLSVYHQKKNFVSFVMVHLVVMNNVVLVYPTSRLLVCVRLRPARMVVDPTLA